MPDECARGFVYRCLHDDGDGGDDGGVPWGNAGLLGGALDVKGRNGLFNLPCCSITIASPVSTFFFLSLRCSSSLLS